MDSNLEKKLTRCFICLEISREAIDEIEEIQKLLKKKNFFYGKFTEPETLHLTLKFLGEISEEKIEEVKSKLGEITFKDFEVHLGEIGTFINRFNAILWIKLNGKGLWELQKQIDNKMNELGFELEERFMSHITLARMKKIINRPEFLDYVKNVKTKPVKFKISEFILKRSELKPEGPVYSDIEKYSV